MDQLKRARSEFTESGRPIIGKIGIGLLAAGQICDEFVVISSKRGEDKKFEAIVDFTEFEREDAYKYALADEKVKIGKFRYVPDLPEKKEEHYTKIILRKIESGFRDRLKGIPNTIVRDFSKEELNVKDFQEFVEEIDRRKISDLTEYDRMIWELALRTPLQYLENGPIRTIDVIPKIRRALVKYDFHVFVDGFELRKPILLPNSPEVRKKERDYEVYQDIGFDDIVEGKHLKIGGYIYQQAVKIDPPELRGILVRIRNVGIGSYDRSILNFPISVGPILSGTSGEIYVEDGLEQALNIDRHSFRETDPHYLKIQSIIFKRMKGPWPTAAGERPGIMTDARTRSKKRVAEKRTNELDLTARSIAKRIYEVTRKKYKVDILNSAEDRPVELDTKMKRIVVHDSSPLFPTTKSLRREVERVLCFYEVARQRSSSKTEVDELFFKLLLAR